MTEFSSLLDVQANTVERPKPLPVGLFDGIVESFEQGESSRKKTPYVRVHVNLIGVGEDVDQDELAAYGDIAGKKVHTNFYLTEGAIFMLKDFLTGTLAMDLEGKTFAQALPEMIGMPLRLEIKHRASTDGEQVFAEVSKTFPAE